MSLKLSMLTAAAVVAMPMAAGAQSTYGSGTGTQADAQENAQEGLTPAQKASKKTVKPSSNAKAAPKAEVETYSQDGLSPAQAASKKSARTDKAKRDAQPAETPPAASAEPAATPQSTAPGQTGTTPGQEQTAPGEASQLTPAVTGTTPSGNTTAQGQAAAETKVTKADVKAGATIFDSAGNSVGTIESVQGNNAVLNTGKVQVKVPLSSLAQGDKGLTIGMSKADIEAQAKAKTK